MGCYDTVLVPCPQCGEAYEAQSKGGECLLGLYTPDTAPPEVIHDLNRHAPFTCDACGHEFSYNP
jgi:predicted RNA-binding Zn-ribbon protein involved in translation (DUF1610 family)